MDTIKDFLSQISILQYVLIAVVLFTIYFLSSLLFSSNSSGIQLIPKNTPFVGVVSAGDILEKANIEDILDLDLNLIEDIQDKMEDAIDMVEDQSEIAAEILKNPYEIGIDINQDLFIYVPVEDIKKSEVYLCVSGGVKNSEKIIEIIEEIEDKIPNNNYDDEYGSQKSYFDLDEDEDYNLLISYTINTYRGYYDDESSEYYRDLFAFAWDDDKFLFITNPDSRDESSVDLLEDEVEKLFNLQSDEKISENGSFNDFYSSKTDLCVWASAEGIDEDLISEMVEEIDDETRGEIDLDEEDIMESSGSLFYNFGDGEISIKTQVNLSEGIQKILKEKLEIETSELSIEYKAKFDESGDNTIHVALRSIITLADQFISPRMLRRLF
ncbi:MAG: hypothetical protein CL846_07745 [Crocinitomicaceae bacterium]|nr:hypothetical protein [Crocinitomicaceae bacterium]